MDAFQNNLLIKEPCYVGWNNMSSSEVGKFCSSCKKNVHDFTNATIDDIKEAYKENNGSLCGHVSSKLIYEHYVSTTIKKTHSGNLKIFGMALFLCFGISLFNVNSLKARTINTYKNYLLNSFTVTNPDSVIIKGKVTDKVNKNPVAYGNISILNNNKIIASTKTDINGAYEIKISKEKYSSVTVQFSSIHYKTISYKNVSTNTTNKAILINMSAAEEEVMMDGMMVDFPDKQP